MTLTELYLPDMSERERNVVQQYEQAILGIRDTLDVLTEVDNGIDPYNDCRDCDLAVKTLADWWTAIDALDAEDVSGDSPASTAFRQCVRAVMDDWFVWKHRALVGIALHHGHKVSGNGQGGVFTTSTHNR